LERGNSKEKKLTFLEGGNCYIRTGPVPSGGKKLFKNVVYWRMAPLEIWGEKRFHSAEGKEGA